MDPVPPAPDEQRVVSPSVPEVVTVSKPKSRILIWVVGGAIILGIGVGVGLLVNKKLSPTSQVTPASLPPETSAKESYPTANWKTYTNTTYLYSIKYPPTWTIGAKGSENVNTFYSPLLESPCNYDSGETCIQIFLFTIPYDNKIDSANPYTINAKDRFSPSFIIRPSDQVLNKISFKLGAKDAVGFEYFQSTYYRPRWQYVVVTNHNDTRFTITFEESQKDHVVTPSNWQHKNTFDQILSTFKFVGDNQNPPVKGQVIVYTMTEKDMTIQFVAKSDVGNITEMKVWTDANPNSGWESFATLKKLPVSDHVYAQYKDDKGNVSKVYSDSIRPKAPAGLAK